MNIVGSSLLKGAKEALNYAQGQKKGSKTHKIKIPDAIDVRAIRDKLAMTRQEFAERFGFSVRTLEKWEQGVRQPESSARAYLMVIAHKPKVVEAILKMY